MYVARDYETRIDRFRRTAGIALRRWAEEAHISRMQLGKYRAGTQEPTLETLAALVSAARRVSGLPVKAADLYDVGEDEPLNTTDPEPFAAPRGDIRNLYDTRFDKCLVREGIRPSRLARTAGMSRLSILRKRAGRESPTVGVLARLVRAMRIMGRDIRASDLFDVGEGT
jgi:transcriptional regulator with XRE-family HTH domain